MLNAANQQLYKGCGYGNSPLSFTSILMDIIRDYNLVEECMDTIVDFVK